MFLAKQAIVRQNLCYMVEGQMDVISMHQAGIENVVCSGGTALTTPQIKLIRRFTNNITVIYDGDAAGIHAALRGIDMFLEEGFNIKVLLLPNGEDPDSFARSHNASDFIEYINSNQVDFIRYKTQALGADAGNDPQKRSELIKSVALSISKIPDIITRQVYIKDSSDQLHIPEQILLREVARLRREEYQEVIKKQKEQEEKKQLEAVIPEPQAGTTIAFTDTFAENFRNLLQLIVRYGEQPLFVSEGRTVLLGEFIISDLQQDQIQMPNSLYQKMTDEYMVHCHDENFTAENFFKFHPDVEISSLAVDLIADRYQISKLFQKESRRLSDIVVQLLLELKYAILLKQINQLEKDIQQAQNNKDTELQLELLKQLNPLLQLRNEFCKRLGNRVITN
ncbi:MAG: toprim domain-containing protein, partial [Paludibacteraceae bacterium]|nr:toprim domain-containing protein [Paludibacteraceae bacterium]